MPDEPIARVAYDELADAFSAQIDTKAHNAFYDRPAILSLLPSVAGKRVLDAGCGPGAYTERLVDMGAEVIGVDTSPRMVAHAKRRLKGKATILEADLGRPLEFLESSSFDLIVSALSLDYIRDWNALFSEFFRLLRAQGHLVFSAHHPFDEFYDHHRAGNYFEVELVDYEFDWPAYDVRVRVPYYRRPLSAMVGPLLGAGFTLERLVEPQPIPEFQKHDSRDYAKLMRQPGFICLRANKNKSKELVEPESKVGVD
ncbi:MAG TPA: class I SAM-dependent methyltransferase [Blastocatellia bacterium]|nr:class I SAM-dependent methyltransferase [Blastocatellia bacterium]